MRIFLYIILFLFFRPLAASEFPKEAGIYLLDSQREELRIGSVKFTAEDTNDPENAAVKVDVDMDNSVFSEHFLSMRPFRCLTDEKEWFCHLEYPYQLRSSITLDDLTDLEYQLLFIKKKPTEFGIDAWNGLYYKLRVEKDGTLTGELLEGDLNSLQSPPSEKYAKPVDLEEFIPGDVSKRLFPVLRIY